MPPQVNGLDRSNVGNAGTQGVSYPCMLIVQSLTVLLGFSTAIGASPDDLNLAVSLFFVTFVLLQPPSAAMGRWLGARHWITFMMASTLVTHRSQHSLTSTLAWMGYLHSCTRFYLRPQGAYCRETYDRSL